MEDVLARIKVFEKTVFRALEKIKSLKEVNSTLINENIRLRNQIKQLKKDFEEADTEKLGTENQAIIPENKISHIELIKRDLEECIEEIDECITKLDNEKR